METRRTGVGCGATGVGEGNVTPFPFSLLSQCPMPYQVNSI
ncbi:MAG: hypothetical protein ACHBN1_17585 [Heteroscytonema crispum UTEX LB 1556]